jgi:hypothetical protein
MDLHTAPVLAEAYFSTIDAPAKQFVHLPQAGHVAILAQPEMFLDKLLAHVWPIAGTHRRSNVGQQ